MTVADRVVEECGSTNDLARELGEQGWPEGTWISARRQTAGRGRQGRSWVGQEGNLFLSMLARPTPEEMRAHGTWLPLAAAVAVAETLARAWPGLGVRIKWPNDLWIGDAKLGGILCEGVAGRGGAFVVIGLGLNCAGAPEGLDLGTISLSAARGEPIVADQVRDPVVHALRAMLDQLRAGGARGLADRYASLAALPPGSAIRWQPGGEPRTGTVLGLGPFGELRVRAPGGAEESLFAEDVSRIRAAN